MNEHHILPLEYALLRWSAVSASWQEMSSGNQPLLSAFLAGWFCRCIGASKPQDEGTFKDSFRVGWREADIAISIEENK